MTAAPTKTARARRWRRLRLGIAALLLGWFGWYAYLRLTVEPPRSVEDIFKGITAPGPREPNDATAELTKLALTVAEEVRYRLPPAPKGMKWTWPAGNTYVLSPQDVLRGPWTPADRPHLRAVIDYLRDDDTRERIASLHDLRGRPWQFDWCGSQEPGYDGFCLSHLYRIAFLLVADARYQHAEQADVVAAWEDLKTALWVARDLRIDGTLPAYAQDTCLRTCLDELRFMSREHTLDDDLLKEMDDQLCQLPSLSRTWPAAITGEEAVAQAIIDASYTRDANGQGWFVLSRQWPLSARLLDFDPVGPDACLPIWNLASFLYNDRQTVEAKRASCYGALRRVVELDYAEAVAEAERLTGPGLPFDLLDGRVLCWFCWHSYENLYSRRVCGEAAREATRVALALARFRGEHGAYPQALAELVPAYLSALPADPFSGATFGYRPVGSNDYVLYSHGRDGDDDGGMPRDPHSGSADDGDGLYSEPRSKPRDEPSLEPIRGRSRRPGGHPDEGTP
ncbi:MAG: hypothetical protein PVJ57_10860 [Phycisphaerae bacterium]|jgi:hypothetical protein